MHHRGYFNPLCTYLDVHPHGVVTRIYEKEKHNYLRYLAHFQAPGRNIDKELQTLSCLRGDLDYCEIVTEFEAADPRSEVPAAHHLDIKYIHDKVALTARELGEYRFLVVWHEKHLQFLLKFCDDRLTILSACVDHAWALWKTGAIAEADKLLEAVLNELAQLAEENHPHGHVWWV